MPLFEALYDRRCKSSICWEEVSDIRIYGSDLIQETIEKIKIIRKRRQKAYADRHRRPLEFSFGDKIF